MRITSFEDVATANKHVVDKIAKLEKAIKDSNSRFDQLQHKYLNTLDSQRNAHTTNNLVFTWTGGSTTLSWPAGNLQDPLGKTEVVKAGSQVLTASTYYWLIWNRAHKRLIAVPGLTNDIFGNHANHILCQIFTGTSGQTGVAGGGGSTSIRDLSGTRYKNF